MQIPRQTSDWYDRLTTLQTGYYYPWHSQLDPDHGEDRYVALVHRHLRSDATVLDVACGHGALTLDFAPHCRAIVGYDRTAAWIALAQEQARQTRQSNATFIVHDSSPGANDGQARLPVADASCDLIVCSKGPFHWLDDARRAARPGATLIMLVPDATPPTSWMAALPERLRWTARPIFSGRAPPSSNASPPRASRYGAGGHSIPRNTSRIPTPSMTGSPGASHRQRFPPSRPSARPWNGFTPRMGNQQG